MIESITGITASDAEWQEAFAEFLAENADAALPSEDILVWNSDDRSD